MNISFANLQYQYQLYKDEIDKAIFNVLNKSNYIMGDEVKLLEDNLAKFSNSKHAITCSSGSVALLLAMMSLEIQPKDEIITTSFSFIASSEMIAFLKAIPVFVDIDERTYNIDVEKIEEKITNKTKAIMLVSLYGQPSNMGEIQHIAKKYNLKVIVDGAQSFGSTYDDKFDVSLGDIAITSFFPSKPLGCFGDGGAVFTNNNDLANRVISLKNHGQEKRYHHKYIGINGRMDTIQCAVLDVKLKYFKKDLKLRQEVAKKYNNSIQNNNIILPFIDKKTTSSFAQYSIRVKNRLKVQKKLQEKNIPTAIHYPLPLHLQECFKYLGYKMGDFPISEMVSNEIISIPMNPYLVDEEIQYISDTLKTLNE